VVLVIEPGRVAGSLRFDVASANGRRLIAEEMSGRMVRTVRPWCWSSSPAASPARCPRQALGADRRRGPAAGGHQVRAVVLVIQPGRVAGSLPFDVASANGRRLIAEEMSGRVVRTVRPWCWSSSPAASPARCGSTWPAPTAAD